MGFKEKLIRFMQGRYGMDELNKALNAAALIGLFASLIVSFASGTSRAGSIVSTVLWIISIAIMGFALFRSFSRNIPARRAENEWYRLHIAAPFTKKKNEVKTRRAQAATHRFFKCPKCGQTVRVPKGKGKIKITCPKYGEEFVRKS